MVSPRPRLVPVSHTVKDNATIINSTVIFPWFAFIFYAPLTMSNYPLPVIHFSLFIFVYDITTFSIYQDVMGAACQHAIERSAKETASGAR
jgi:hypothetical protein